VRGWTADDVAALKTRTVAHVDRYRRYTPIPPDVDSEKVLQVSVEAMLDRRGYLRMTPDNFTRARLFGDVRGFFAHWPKCKGNPTMPDVLVVDVAHRRPPLMMELKVRDVWQPGQKEAVALGLWVVAWTVKEAEGILDGWEGGMIEQKDDNTMRKGDASASLGAICLQSDLTKGE
jgi:hypothetical protein